MKFKGRTGFSWKRCSRLIWSRLSTILEKSRWSLLLQVTAWTVLRGSGSWLEWPRRTKCSCNACKLPTASMTEISGRKISKRRSTGNKCSGKTLTATANTHTLSWQVSQEWWVRLELQNLATAPCLWKAIIEPGQITPLWGKARKGRDVLWLLAMEGKDLL